MSHAAQDLISDLIDGDQADLTGSSLVFAADSAGRELAAEQWATHQRLRVLLAAPAHDAAFVAAVLRELTPTVAIKARPVARRRPPSVRVRRQARAWTGWVAPLLAACLAVVVGVIIVVNRAPPAAGVAVAMVVDVEGDPADFPPIGGALDATRTYTVPADTAVHLRLADGSRILLRAARFAVPAGHRVRLDAGSLTAEAPPRPAASGPLTITTPHAEARVLGTAFTIRVAANTRLDVSRGRVALVRHRDGQDIEVTAGTFAEVGTDAPLMATPAAVPSGSVAVAIIDLDGNVLPGLAALPATQRLRLADLPSAGIALRLDSGVPLASAIMRMQRLDGGTVANEWERREGMAPFIFPNDRHGVPKGWSFKPGTYRFQAEAIAESGGALPAVHIEFVIEP